MTLRVAFTMFGDDASWAGGLNSLRNLFSALADLPGRPLEPVLFVSPETAPQALPRWCPYLPPHPLPCPVGATAAGGAC